MKKSKKSKRSVAVKNESEVFAHFGNRVKYGLMNAKEEEAWLRDKSMSKSRTDYAHIVDIRIPQGYHAQVKKAWEMYELDRIFRYLVDRSIDFGTNGFEWELAYTKEKTEGWLEFIQRVTGKKDKKVLKVEKEKNFWNAWASTINKDVPNVIQGLDEVIKWAFKSFQLNAMAPMNWEWGTMEVDGEKYQVPIRMTLQNCLSVALVRNSAGFLDEEFWVKVARGNLSQTQKVQSADAYMQPKKGDKNWHQIPILNAPGKEDKDEQGFVIKYQWSPSDNTAWNQGRTISVGQGLYPTPPYVGMYDILMLRRALIASDLAILDGVIHYILDWSIGDNTTDANGRLVNQPRVARKDSSGAIMEKSSIQLAKEAITADNRGPVMQLFHPYYYKLNIMTPDVTSLISTEKYSQSTAELLSGFGILVSPSGRNINLDDINTQNFEESLENMRSTIKRFIESLCAEIVRRNDKTLTIVPNMIFNVLNTKLEAFRTSILNLVKIGKVSTETLLQTHGLDNKVEAARIGKELISGQKDLNDKNVPISYKQTATGQDGESSTTGVSSEQQGGRPQGAKGTTPKPKKKSAVDKL